MSAPDDRLANGVDAAFGVHREWTLHRDYPLACSDGQPARVLVCRLPAAFYRLEALPYGDKPGFALATGSGHAMQRLAEQMAAAISQGMLGLARPEEDSRMDWLAEQMVRTLLDVLRDVKALWDAQGFGDDDAVSEPLYHRLAGAIAAGQQVLEGGEGAMARDHEAALEVEASCGHWLSPERDDAPPCPMCDACTECCPCCCEDCHRPLRAMDECLACLERATPKEKRDDPQIS
jgi:hypothetical protein